MSLDLNNSENGNGKYAVINLRKLPTSPNTPEELAAAILANPECVEFGRPGDPDEFFVIKLKDQYADKALEAYANEVFYESESTEETEYAQRVTNLAMRSGIRHPLCKKPD